MTKINRNRQDFDNLLAEIRKFKHSNLINETASPSQEAHGESYTLRTVQLLWRKHALLKISKNKNDCPYVICFLYCSVKLYICNQSIRL